MKRTALIISAAAIAFAGGLSVHGLISSSSAQISQESQNQLPEFSLPDISGKPRSISEWQGKILVINFWATWCPPCLKEMPEFEAMHKQYADKGLQVVGIALDDPEPVKEFIAKQNITYPILISQEQGTKIAHNLGNIVNTVPFTVIANQQGQIIKRKMGTLTGAELLEVVNPLLKKK